MTRRSKVVIAMIDFNTLFSVHDRINCIPSTAAKVRKIFPFSLQNLPVIPHVILTKSQNPLYALQFLHDMDSTHHWALSPPTLLLVHPAVVILAIMLYSLTSPSMFLPRVCTGCSLCLECSPRRIHMNPFFPHFLQVFSLKSPQRVCTTLKEGKH